MFDVSGKIVLSHQEEFEQKYPEPGYVLILQYLSQKTMEKDAENEKK